jgi:hypothetical protein
MSPDTLETVARWTPVALPWLSLAVGFALGRWCRRPPEAPGDNPWEARTAREWVTRERWTHSGERHDLA